jgi:hypothetical protein
MGSWPAVSHAWSLALQTSTSIIVDDRLRRPPPDAVLPRQADLTHSFQLYADYTPCRSKLPRLQGRVKQFRPSGYYLLSRSSAQATKHRALTSDLFAIQSENGTSSRRGIDIACPEILTGSEAQCSDTTYILKPIRSSNMSGRQRVTAEVRQGRGGGRNPLGRWSFVNAISPI